MKQIPNLAVSLAYMRAGCPLGNNCHCAESIEATGNTELMAAFLAHETLMLASIFGPTMASAMMSDSLEGLMQVSVMNHEGLLPGETLGVEGDGLIEHESIATNNAPSESLKSQLAALAEPPFDLVDDEPGTGGNVTAGRERVVEFA